VAIDGTADEPLTGTAPPYFSGSRAVDIPAFTMTDIDRMSSRPVVALTPFEVLALGAYRGDLRLAIHQMKFRNARWIAARFGRNLGEVAREVFGDWHPDLVTWAPTTRRRARMRGHDQSAVVAAGLARVLRVRRIALLRRIDDRTQTGASRLVRTRGPQYMVRSGMARQRRVLLVDDVMTTGTTLVRAREALLAAGALDVRCAVIARVR